MNLGNTELIKELRAANLQAECTHCGQEFGLFDSILFDGLGKFPEPAEQRKQEMKAELSEQNTELKKRKVSVAGSEQKAVDVGIGKIIEKVLPAYKDFRYPLSDCRALFEPIDLIVFSGASKMNVESITFLEIKTGKSSLNKHQRIIRDAIKDKQVKYEEV